MGLFLCVVTALLTMIHVNIQSMQRNSQEMVDKLERHLLDTNIHATGFAKVEGQIGNLLEMMRLVHDRVEKWSG